MQASNEGDGLLPVSLVSADVLAMLTVRRFNREQLARLIPGDCYADTVAALGYDPLAEAPQQ